MPVFKISHQKVMQSQTNHPNNQSINFISREMLMETYWSLSAQMPALMIKIHISKQYLNYLFSKLGLRRKANCKLEVNSYQSM